MLVHVPTMAVCNRRAPEPRVALCLQNARLFYQHADHDSRGVGAVRRQCMAIPIVPFFFYANVNSLREIRIKTRL